MNKSSNDDNLINETIEYLTSLKKEVKETKQEQIAKLQGLLNSMCDCPCHIENNIRHFMPCCPAVYKLRIELTEQIKSLSEK